MKYISLDKVYWFSRRIVFFRYFKTTFFLTHNIVLNKNIGLDKVDFVLTRCSVLGKIWCSSQVS